MDDFDFSPNQGESSSTPMDELRTIARNMAISMIGQIDWTDFKQMARFVTIDDGDADIVVRLMQNAKIEVTT